MRSLALFWLIPLGAIYFLFPLPPIQLSCGTVGGFLIFSWLISFLGNNALIFLGTKSLVRSFPGQSFEISIVLKNRLPIPTGPLMILDSIGNFEISDGSVRSEVRLGAFQQLNITYSLIGRTRGAWELGPVSVEGSDPAGLFPWKIQLGPVRTAVIYPKTPMIEGLPFLGNQVGDLQHPPGPWPDVSRIRALRYPEPGEDLRNMDACTSARFGRIVVKEFDKTLFAPGLILLNLCAGHYPVKNRYLYTERAVESAASVASMFFKRRESLGLVTNGLLPETRAQGVIPGKTPDLFTEIMETLAYVRPNDQELWSDPSILLGQVKSFCHALYIGPPPTEAIDRVLEFLFDRGLHITLLYVGTSALAPVSRKGMSRGILGDYGEIRLQVI